MIKNTKLLALSLSSLFILTACGGGGGGSSDSGVSVNQPPKPPTASKLEIDGNIVLVGETYGKKTKYQKSDDVDILLVDGKKIQIGMVDYNLGSYSDILKPADSFVESAGGGSASSYASYGTYIINPEDSNGLNRYKGFGLYYQGYVTPENAMPKSGVVYYRSGFQRKSDDYVTAGFKGGASIYINKDNSYRWISTGDVNLKADFGKKELTGTVGHYYGESANLTYKDTQIHATIKGNKFAGDKNNVTTEGKFFGPNAEGIAGTFNDKNQKLIGVFGAERD
ncbi:MAG: transferrin-binding protein-like solute binding protein [Neisseriaceae bacterium]|nr:transferrin-binding protein-like solute binding protein [Neisseriaceae bacterium]MBR3425840.1 transferrin-binding protein-like solute binding protein [Neisseriaceae bacterium]